ncbi:MAG: heme ABC exporter ATP-binding protein CcmA [Candidatus Hydrothermarchaeales archaeon]
MIEVLKLQRKFGDYVAIDDLNLSIDKGESFAILGPNGAGKTTLIKVLSTVLRPTSGTIKINGHDIIEDAEEVKRQIGVVSHNSFLYEELTARENLEFYSRLYRISDNKKIDTLLDAIELNFRADDLVSTFSRGMLQRLSIARSLLHGPEVLLLDEPATGLDVKSKHTFFEMIKEQNKGGKTVVLTTHHLEEAEELCQKVAIMDRGRVIKSGAIDEIKSEIGSLEEAFVRFTKG